MNWTAENVVLDDQEADNAWVNETTLHSCVRVEGDNGVLAFVCAATDDAARTAADELEHPRAMEVAHLEALLEDREWTLQDHFDRGLIPDWRPSPRAKRIRRSASVPMEGYERDASGFYS